MLVRGMENFCWKGVVGKYAHPFMKEEAYSTTFSFKSSRSVAVHFHFPCSCKHLRRNVFGIIVLWRVTRIVCCFIEK